MHPYGASIESSAILQRAHQHDELFRIGETHHRLIGIRPRIEPTIRNEERGKFRSPGSTERSQDGERRQPQLSPGDLFIGAVTIEIHRAQCLHQSVPWRVSLHDDSTVTDRSSRGSNQPCRDLRCSEARCKKFLIDVGKDHDIWLTNPVNGRLGPHEEGCSLVDIGAGVHHGQRTRWTSTGLQEIFAKTFDARSQVAK